MFQRLSCIFLVEESLIQYSSLLSSGGDVAHEEMQPSWYTDVATLFLSAVL